MAVEVDPRVGSAYSGDFNFRRHLKRAGVPVRERRLDFGDFAWTGNGPNGLARFGIERKTVDEILTAVNDSRFRRRQVTGLLNSFDFPILIVEGKAWPDPHSGVLMNGKFEAGRTKQRHLWENYFKFQLSLMFKARLWIIPTRSKSETVLAIKGLYDWSTAKTWAEHKAVYVVDETKPDEAILTADSMPRRTCAQWPQVAWKRSTKVEEHFKGCIACMTEADVDDWNQALSIEKGTKIAAALVDSLRTCPRHRRRALRGAGGESASARAAVRGFIDSSQLADEVLRVRQRRLRAR